MTRNSLPLVCLLSLCTTGGYSQPNSTAAKAFRPGDVFEIRVTGIPAQDQNQFVNMPLTVSEEGFIVMPHLGRVRADGLSQPELEQALSRKLIEGEIYRSPIVTIIVPEAEPYITMGGQLKSPHRVVWEKQPAAASPEKRDLKALFLKLDGNSDQTLSFEEFSKLEDAEKAVAKEATEAAATAKTEAKKPATVTQEKLHSAFNNTDRNHDGFLTLDELKTMKYFKNDPAGAERSFKRRDKNADGRVTFEEFASEYEGKVMAEEEQE